jgi:hypothetical protein
MKRINKKINNTALAIHLWQWRLKKAFFKKVIEDCYKTDNQSLHLLAEGIGIGIVHQEMSMDLVQRLTKKYEDRFWITFAIAYDMLAEFKTSFDNNESVVEWLDRAVER